MIVKKNIGPLRIDGVTYRFKVGGGVPKEVVEYWKKTQDFDSLVESEVIGIGNEPVRQSKKGQSANPEQRTDSANNGKEQSRGAEGSSGEMDVDRDRV